ncbi:hypothetical protein BVG79_00310 [Ketogulonicigenium robustum]|uniref:Uncharacterized protein n=1 Tax=Ketogulonicigenium robustum TaxID=92947 RepID=A0A1W6NWM8_9RHOB|nr:hypothetical protein [Ketogulonicigenium robustum]ARO13668.1 hypothetical protein BVG79_00310 [Ketogulonicigenium robustum]
MKLIPTRIVDGVWEGVLSGALSQPHVVGVHLGSEVPIDLSAQDEGNYALRVEIPRAMLSSGTQTLTIRDAETGAELGHFVLPVGEQDVDAAQVELAALRAELDLLKTAFRALARDTEEFQRIVVEQMEAEMDSENAE